jgi:hypothetical protein
MATVRYLHPSAAAVVVVVVVYSLHAAVVYSPAVAVVYSRRRRIHMRALRIWMGDSMFVSIMSQHNFLKILQDILDKS